MEIIDFFNVPSDWTDFFFHPEIECLLYELNEKNFSFPKKSELLCPFFKAPLERISVVIIGDDPKEFSYSISRLSKTFQSIYKELENESYYPIKDGNIEHWSKQGVLTFTSPLTNNPSESEGELTDRIISELNKNPNLIWIVFGTENEKRFREKIESDRIYFINKDNLSGSMIFRKINKDLIKQGKQPICW